MKYFRGHKSVLAFAFVLLAFGCEKGEEPTITTLPITDITATTATSGGDITSEGTATVIERGICWSTGTTPTVDDSITINGAGAGSFTSEMQNLFGGTTYFVRAYAINDVGIGYGMALSFTTSGQPPSEPTIISQYATNIQTESARLIGTVNANYYSATITFEYGTDETYGMEIAAIESPVEGGENTNVSATIDGLNPGTIYHCRIKAENSLGTTFSDNFTFQTLGDVPIAYTAEASNITLTSGQLNGVVNPNYLETIVTFEYGTTNNYGSEIVAIQSPVSGTSNVDVSAIIPNLVTGTEYHFRVKAENQLGITYGNDITFTPDYVIGGILDGNIIFYIDETGEHGLVCAPTDQATGISWGCYGTTLSGADGTAVGTGMQNTIDIVNGCSTENIAARICYDLELNGFTDWYLPSKDELNLMFYNLKRRYLGDFASIGYWSSSENNEDNTEAWWQWFGDSGTQDPNKKDHPANVRAVRSF